VIKLALVLAFMLSLALFYILFIMGYLDNYLLNKDFTSALHYLNTHQAQNFEFALTTYPTGSNALIYASILGQVDIVQCMLEQYTTQKHLEFKNDYGLTAFLAAIMHNQKEVAQLLLNSGANIHEKDQFNRKALELAVYFSANDTLEYLLNLELIDKKSYAEPHLGASSLVYKAVSNDHYQTLDILLSDEYFLSVAPLAIKKLESNMYDKKAEILKSIIEKRELEKKINQSQSKTNQIKI
jgi:hypothetical protein